jgi:hypothetical protein
MKHSKSHGCAGGGSAGLSGLLSNYDAYQRWVRAAHERVQFVKVALAMVDTPPAHPCDLECFIKVSSSFIYWTSISWNERSCHADGAPF